MGGVLGAHAGEEPRYQIRVRRMGAPQSAGEPERRGPCESPMVNPLTNALVYHEFFRHSDMVALGVATGGMNTLALDGFGDPNGYGMEGLVVRVLHDHFAGTLP